MPILPHRTYIAPRAQHAHLVTCTPHGTPRRIGARSHRHLFQNLIAYGILFRTYIVFSHTFLSSHMSIVYSLSLFLFLLPPASRIIKKVRLEVEQVLRRARCCAEILGLVLGWS